MKITVLSDIHGNLPALEAVTEHIAAWHPDHVVVNGDTVNRGPSSLSTWQFVQAQPSWQLLKGNHEDYVIGHGQGNDGQDGKWTAQIVRLLYDREWCRRDYFRAGFLAEAGPVGWLVFYEWWQAKGIVYPWLTKYYEAILAGEIELETAVTGYLSELGLAGPQI